MMFHYCDKVGRRGKHECWGSHEDPAGAATKGKAQAARRNRGRTCAYVVQVSFEVLEYNVLDTWAPNDGAIKLLKLNRVGNL